MKDKLNLTEIVDALAEKAGINKKTADAMIREFSDLISEGLENEGMVKVRGLGTFKLKKVAARVGRNLQTGESIEIPPHNKVTFTPDNKLRDMVNEEFELLTYKELPGKAPAPKVTPPAPATTVSTTPPPRPTPPPPPKPAPAPPPPRPTPPPVAQTPPPRPATTPASTPTHTAASRPTTPPPKPFRPTPPPPKPPEDKKKEEPRRRRPYWIIPVVLIIIAILFIIFYFRACQKTDQPVEPVKEEVVIKPQTPVVEKDTVTVEKKEEVKVPVKEPPKSTDYVLRSGNYLYQLAGQFYGDSLFWVLIYKENAHKISNPEDLVFGDKLVIPTLEGDRYNLTHNDSLNLSEGYRMLYEYYTIDMHPDAANYFFGMNRYKPR